MAPRRELKHIRAAFLLIRRETPETGAEFNSMAEAGSWIAKSGDTRGRSGSLDEPAEVHNGSCHNETINPQNRWDVMRNIG